MLLIKNKPYAPRASGRAAGCGAGSRLILFTSSRGQAEKLGGATALRSALGAGRWVRSLVLGPPGARGGSAGSAGPHSPRTQQAAGPWGTRYPQFTNVDVEAQGRWGAGGQGREEVTGYVFGCTWSPAGQSWGTAEREAGQPSGACGGSPYLYPPRLWKVWVQVPSPESFFQHLYVGHSGNFKVRAPHPVSSPSKPLILSGSPPSPQPQPAGPARPGARPRSWHPQSAEVLGRGAELNSLFQPKEPTGGGVGPQAAD